jgi:hypothetical protein
MGHFYYRRHFVALSLLAALLAATRPLRPSLGIAATFGLYGALHSIALTASLRARGSAAGKLLFVSCATVLSAANAAMGLYSARFLGSVPSLARPVLLLAISAGLGAIGYAWLVRRFWFADLAYGAIAAIGVGCVAASLIVGVSGAVPATSDGLWVAVAWWLAFSAGLAFCDRESIKIAGQ